MMNHATSESHDPGVALTALAAASRWAGRAAELAAKPGGRDEDRLASGLFLLVSGSGATAGALWALAYALLGRPLSAAIPGAFAVAATAIGITLLRRRNLGRLREFMLLLILLLPALLRQPGGLCQGQRGRHVVIFR